MIETSLIEFMQTNLPTYDYTYGKLAQDTVFTETPIIQLIKSPSLNSDTTPTSLGNFDISVRHEYIDVAQQAADDIIRLFQLYSGTAGDYQIWVVNINEAGTVYEEEDIVNVLLLLSIKYVR
jgi:hypothetical protein